MSVPLTITSVRFKARQIPRFDFTHQGVQYRGKQSRWAAINLGLKAEKTILPYTWMKINEPQGPELTMTCLLMPGTKLVSVDMKGSVLNSVLARVGNNADNPLAIVATLSELKMILQPYFDLT